MYLCVYCELCPLYTDPRVFRFNIIFIDTGTHVRELTDTI